MKLSLILPALASIIVGCNSYSSQEDNQKIYFNEYTVDIDPIVLDANDTVINSLKSWEDIANVKFNIIINKKTCDDNCYKEFTITSVPTISFTTMDTACSDGSCIALTYVGDTASNVMLGDTVVSGVDNYTFPQTATHEIGHALGLIHTGDGTIMCAYQSCEPTNITCQDLNQYNSLRNLPLEGCD